MALVEPDPGGELGEVVGVGLGEIPFDPEMTEQCGGAAQRQRHVPAGLVRERRGYVRAEVLRRNELPGPALNRLPGQGIGHV